jgi:flagellar hook protein FlgE
MFETILIGTSGLLTHSKGLRIVGNNLANVNTPGFKGSQLEFASLVEQGAGHGLAGDAGSSGLGHGLTSTGTHISFRAGVDQVTGSPLDLSIDGNGFYTVKREGRLLYTRSGDFHVDDKGLLVNSNGDHVQGLDAQGQLTDINVNSFARGTPKATSAVRLAGNLTSTVSTPSVDITVKDVQIYDANGVSHPVDLTFKNNGNGDYGLTVAKPDGTTITISSL